MDWVQCNTCCIKLTQIKLFLTQCAHILCQNCLAKAKSSVCCPLCNKKLNACEIGKNLSPDFMELFKDVRQIASESMAELGAVVKFQQSLRDFYVKLNNAKAEKEAETFNLSRKNREAIGKEMERQKIGIQKDDEHLKALKSQKRQLTEKLHTLKRRLSSSASALPPPPLSLRMRTEPPISKTQRFVPPSVPRKKSIESTHDQSVSEIVTSTPISGLKFSRRDFYTAGEMHPSPIPREGV